ncbi:MAG TPA: MFS transporter, partial [Nocardioidaceae bacterium]
MRFTAALRRLLAHQRFRQLFAVRLTSQAADGVIQVALASYILFSPERQPDAASIAGALAAVLLPFSVLGPFVGVFLDRWSRRQVLLLSNLARLAPVLGAGLLIAGGAGEAPLFAVVLLAFSINRFFLAALSAALPHVVDPDELVLANSVTPTSGTIAFMVGLGAATGLRHVLPGQDPDAAVVMLAAAGYLTAALLALRLPRALLGPDLGMARAAVREDLHNVVTGLIGGLRHLEARRPAAYALVVIASHRFFYGLSTVATILLYRNSFHP